MLAQRFTSELLDHLAVEGVATMERRRMRVGRRRIDVTWIMITDAGRRAMGV
jgi:hypothetical protein